MSGVTMNHKQIPPRLGTIAYLEPVDDAPTTAADVSGSGDAAARSTAP